jgi:hypothetical protein
MTKITDFNTSAASPSSPHSLAALSGDVDFVLYGDDQADAIGDDDDPLYTFHSDAQSAESYLPWTSPGTRLRKNESIIELFSQTYNGTQDYSNPTSVTCGGDPNPVLSNTPFRDIQHYSRPENIDQIGANISIKVESPVLTADAAFPGKRKREYVEAPARDSEKASGAVSSLGYRSVRKTSAGRGATNSLRARGAPKQEDSSGDDGCPPTKRPKKSPSEDFTDNSMPDIFRFAHPDI